MAVVTVRPAGNDQKKLIAAFNKAVTLINEMKADHNALLAKLDADSGVGDTNYATTNAVAAPDADTLRRSY